MAIINQQTIMDRCWDGDRDRDCEYCPAHSSKNGQCCFGTRFEYGDPPCMECPHHHDCARVTQQGIEEESRSMSSTAPRRIILNRNQPAPSTFSSRLTNPSRSVEGLLSSRMSEPEPIQVSEEISFIKLVGIHAAWGAMEGALELLIAFFRRRRPN